MKKSIQLVAIAAAMTFTAAASAQTTGSLFVEGFGAFTFANGTSDSIQDGAKSTDTAATAKTYKTNGTTGIGGGLNVGYFLADNLAGVVGYNFRSFSSRKFTNDVNNGAGSTAADTQATYSQSVVTLGLRPTVTAFGGTFYAGAGWAVILPYEIEQKTEWAAPTTGGLKSQVQVDKYNMTLTGMYGELGYMYDITPELYISGGIKLFVATTDNIGKTRVTTNTSTTGSVTTDTRNYKDSTTGTGESAVTVGTATTRDEKFRTQGITDFSFQIAAGYRL